MKLPRTLLALLIAVLSTALIASSCSDDTTSVVEDSDGGGDDAPSGDSGSDGGTDSGDDSDGDTTVEAGRGWLEGEEVEWSASSDADTAGTAASAEFSAVAEEDGADLSRSVDDEGAILPPEPRDDSPLQAGSIDDGADVGAYLEYRDLVAGSGIAVRPLVVTESTLVTVMGNNGLPVLGATVEFWDPTADTTDPLVSLSTTATGTVRFLPDPLVGDRFDRFDLEVVAGDAREVVSFDRGTDEVTVTLPMPGGVDGSVPLDVHFVLDATGSMDDEIDRLRDNMMSVAEQIAALPSDPDVRFGMTVYRDEGDLFVTRTFDLTDDLGEFLDALAVVTAEGGGDYPEAMDEALADALTKPAWRAGAVQVMVLIADAPPQITRQVETTYTATAIAALEQGVKIFPVAASGTDDQAEYVMRELAFVTGGRFVFLSYGVDGSEGTATGDLTDIAPDDYDQLPLDQLVVKLVQDELEALNGEEPQQ